MHQPDDHVLGNVTDEVAVGVVSARKRTFKHSCVKVRFANSVSCDHCVNFDRSKLAKEPKKSSAHRNRIGESVTGLARKYITWILRAFWENVQSVVLNESQRARSTRVFCFLYRSVHEGTIRCLNQCFHHFPTYV